MTIAARFRTVVWVAAVAVAALGCYLISLRVAAERAQVAKIDARLTVAEADLRQLATELDTRGRLVQLERWNGEVLGLTAPKASQYLSGEMQLASLISPAAEPAGVPQTPAAAELMAPAEVAKVAYRKPEAGGGSRLLHSVSLTLDDGGAAALRPAALLAGGAAALRPAIATTVFDGKIRRP